MKIFCWIFGHKFLYPNNEMFKNFVGGICVRCLKLSPLEPLNFGGCTITWTRLGGHGK